MLLPILIISLSLFQPSVSADYHSSSIPENFIRCLSHEFRSNASILNPLLHFPGINSSYESIWSSGIENLRFLEISSSNRKKKKPLAIITPESYSQVQTTVKCCRNSGLRIIIRSGGHDFEGSSHASSSSMFSPPSVMVDLRKHLRSIKVDLEDNSAWVESGASLGELYYAIALKSPVHGFPGGLFATVGIGGHFSGGGVGNLIRKYGLAADNVLDAMIVDANGRILDKNSMGDDHFWAIRGGGGASFGVILAWKISLVKVSPIVTVFEVSRSLEHGAIDLIHKWQEVAHKAHEDLLLSVVLSSAGGSTVAQTTATFRSLFLGRSDDLVKMMEEIFPEIGLRKQDCEEMSWIESVMRFSLYPKGVTSDALKNRVAPFPPPYFKGKVDLVYKPIPYETLDELWKRCSSKDYDRINNTTTTTPPIIQIDFYPYGGKMNEISKSETPFPHRKGVLYEILYIVAWLDQDENNANAESYMNWLRGLYDFMTPFVSKGPRGAIVNARDFDLGTNDGDGHIACGSWTTTSPYSKAYRTWGSRYFGDNFRRLATVKREVDPENFFFSEQSIPPLFLHPQMREMEL